MHVHVSLCLYARERKRVCIMCVCVHLCVCVHVCLSTCAYVLMSVHPCMSVFVCVCAGVCFHKSASLLATFLQKEDIDSFTHVSFIFF